MHTLPDCARVAPPLLMASHRPITAPLPNLLSHRPLLKRRFRANIGESQ